MKSILIALLALAVSACARSRDIEARLREQIIPEVVFRDATIVDLTNWFCRVTGAADPLRRPVPIRIATNGFWRIPDERIARMRIDLHVEELPVYNILELATRQTDTKFWITNGAVEIVEGIDFRRNISSNKAMEGTAR